MVVYGADIRSTNDQAHIRVNPATVHANTYARQSVPPLVKRYETGPTKEQHVTEILQRWLHDELGRSRSYGSVVSEQTNVDVAKMAWCIATKIEVPGRGSYPYIVKTHTPGEQWLARFRWAGEHVDFHDHLLLKTVPIGYGVRALIARSFDTSE